MAKIYLKRVKKTGNISCTNEDGQECYCVQKYKNKEDKDRHIYICNSKNSKIGCYDKDDNQFIFVQVKRPD